MCSWFVYLAPMDHNPSEMILYHWFMLQQSPLAFKMAFKHDLRGKRSGPNHVGRGAVAKVILISVCGRTKREAWEDNGELTPVRSPAVMKFIILWEA